MRAGSIRVALLASLAGALLHAPRASASAPGSSSFDYVYVETNSGTASGGHVAIVLDGVAFHFQHGEPGIIRSVKESVISFQYSYRGLGNRPLRVSRVAASTDTVSLLRAQFERRHAVQNAHLDLLEAARRDRSFLEVLRSDHADWSASGVSIPGAGYFYCSSSVAADDAARVAPVLDDLRGRIARRLGSRFLPAASEGMRDEIDRLDPRELVAASPARVEPGIMPDSAAGFADRYRELLQSWLAVEIVRGARDICPGSLRTSPDAAFALSSGEIAALRVRSQALSERLATLLGSRRSENGHALLVGLARLVALQRSIDTGRLFILDTFSAPDDNVSADEVRALGDVVGAIRAERAEDFDRDRGAAFATITVAESVWSRLEVTANLLLELDTTLARGAPLRVHPASMLPSRSAARRPSWPTPRRPPEALEPALRRARSNEASIERQILALYRYDLLTRNCVTELFDTIDAALGGRDNESAAARAQLVSDSRTRLGGRVDGQEGLNFIPLWSLHAVDLTYRVQDRMRLPSYRELRIDELGEPQRSALVRLRESNTITSTVYKPSLDDGIFLFFNDGPAFARPFLGGLNLVAAGGAALIGIVAAPFDRAAIFTAALRGALFSLPELGFVNIRKGTMPALPRRWVEMSARSARNGAL